jgi:GH25 family lysozyme M1 (1,4-beta-N-acetylmuramidase)
MHPRTHLEPLGPVLPVSAPRRAGRRRTHASAILAGLTALAVLAPTALAAPSPRSSGVAPGSSDATSSTVEGIDVSHWQGTIDWAKVAGAGKRFAIIKATDSTDYVDPMYATNHAQAKANGIWTGAYHFARPDATANDAAIEAAWFVAHANLGAGDLIPALDLEVSGGLSITGLQAWVMAFVGEVTAQTGVRPMIYTSPAFWKKYMGDTTALADAGYKTLWVAHWGVSAPTVPANNWGGNGWTFWQYTSDGTVPGITGRVDLDRYNGTDFTPVAYSTFKLSATVPSGYVKQGRSSAVAVGIARTNFTSAIALDVTGLPAGATAAYDANPVDDNGAVLTVTTDPDPAATPTGTYPLTITGVADGITRTVNVNLVVADGIPPTVYPPITRLWAGRTLGTTTVPVRVTWVATDPSGLAWTALQKTVNGTTWAALKLPSAAALAADSSIAIGGSARYRVQASDKKANASSWVRGPLVTAQVHQQTSSAVRWTGTWRSASATWASGGSLRYATARGASASFSFTGSSVAWVAAKGPTRGAVWVYVDGVFAASVSLYASSSQARSIVFARTWPTLGWHTLKIVVAGTAGHPRVDVDAFVRLVVS